MVWKILENLLELIVKIANEIGNPELARRVEDILEDAEFPQFRDAAESANQEQIDRLLSDDGLEDDGSRRAGG